MFWGIKIKISIHKHVFVLIRITFIIIGFKAALYAAQKYFLKIM